MLSPTEDIECVPLRGKRVLLEPLGAEHISGLAAAIADGELWSIPVTLVPHPNELAEFVEQAETRRSAQLEMPFATLDLASGAIVGSTRFMKIDREHRHVEIGFTFIAQSRQRSYVNTEAKYLMLRHAFEQWACNRVEFLTDSLNTRSRTAIQRIGAKEEGVLRNHMIMRDGRLRDSILYSIIRSEWPAVRAALEHRIAAA